jgi:glutathione S-transferase
VQVLGQEALIPYRVFWQPGCSSCQKLKEFLLARGIDFESVNVREDPQAAADLARLGARSIPVLSHGDRYTFGQSLDDVARFLGVDGHATTLTIDELGARITRLLEIVRAESAALPPPLLEALWPGRTDRGTADLAYHVPMIANATLAALHGGVLEFEWFERRPQGTARQPEALAATCRATATQWAAWQASGPRPATVSTYYGTQPLAGVLERTAWHMAQHVRQLQQHLRDHGATPSAPLQPADLAGLPMPEGL